MSKLTDKEKTRLLKKALKMLERANFLLEKSYQAHCKKNKTIDKK